MAKGLGELKRAGLKHAARLWRHKCHTCKNAKVAAALTSALAAMKRDPAAYRGVTREVLWDWSGAKAAGIGKDAFGKHLKTHCE